MNIYSHCVLAFALRIGFLLYSTIQDYYHEVKYTDVDYQIFSDAATYVWNNQSPFKRPTYRYSPILAYMLLPNVFLHADFGKWLFCVLDIVTSLFIYAIQKKCSVSIDMCKKCAFLWLYNPMVIVISTRGSSESVMTVLIMLLLLLYVNDKQFWSGLVYGFAIHMKIYPCIYAVSLYFMLSREGAEHKKGLAKFKELFYPSRKKVTFVLSSALGFLIPTLLSIHIFGFEYIDEAFLYHIKRKDVRHNFSPYFYFLYLSDTFSPRLCSIISFSSFLVQLVLISLVSWVFCTPKILPSCLFIETFIFVTFNKVCTSQYFLWYLCLFPLCYPLLSKYTKEVVSAFALWFGGQAVWLISAYYLEFKGSNTFFYIFLASILFFTINVFLIGAYIKLIVKSKLLNVKTAIE